MPILNLVDKDGSLYPDAGFRLIALMACPENRQKRHRLLRMLRENTLADEALYPHMAAGSVVGDLVLYMLQDFHTGRQSYSFNKALPLASAAVFHDAGLPLEGLGPLENRADAKSDLEKLGSRRTGRKSVLADFHRFRPVAHYWAAWVHVGYFGDQNAVDFIRPRETPEEGAIALANFVGVSEAILDLTAPMPLKRTPREPLLAKPWRVRLPNSLPVPKKDIGIPQVSAWAEMVRRKALGKPLNS